MEINHYVNEITAAYSSGKATEHTYRPALQSMLESVARDLQIVNEPRRMECGAPDLVVLRDAVPVGYVECKDIGKKLDEVEKSEQLKRYRSSLPNLILTNYLEFCWYYNGEIQMRCALGSLDQIKQKIHRSINSYLSFGQLLNAFLYSDSPFIGTTAELAERMGKTAQLIRDAITKALKMEDRGGTLHHQMEGFRTTLMHDITDEKFADMYAQTICYGLFMARVNHQSGLFTRQIAPHLLPKSNPFLRKMFEHIAGIDLDERISWAVDNLATLFHHTDMHNILAEFWKRTDGKDPILHFYEDFLAQYDLKLRKARGVYYTPEPVVSYIVRSVDKILKRDFNLPQGLADATKIEVEDSHGNKEQVHKVQILDPAVGTGSFLHGVVDHIRQDFIGNEGLWNGYVDHDLLPRLFGFELLMAPYTIAHFKVGMLLRDSDYEFKDKRRLGIYLTNTLEEGSGHINNQMSFTFVDWLYQEVSEAAYIKSDASIMVVLGNPPYSGHSENKSDWIKESIQPYFLVDGKPLGERNPKWLNDDYVKFLRFAQMKIEQTGYGILAFITNHGYLDNPTFRGMRQSLMKTFDEIFILDLHGNTKKREKCPDGTKDENVFDIQQGVSIGVFVKKEVKQKSRRNKKIVDNCKILHANLWGKREAKYAWLGEHDIETSNWTELDPISPFYLFSEKKMDHVDEYTAGWSINDIFPINSVGIVTARDELTISMTPDEQWHKIVDFAEITTDKARDKYNLGKDSDWTVESAQKDIKSTGIQKEKILPILYRPFDLRYTFYTGTPNGYHTRTRFNTMTNMLTCDNLALLSSRQQASKGFQHTFCTRSIVESCAVSNKTKEITYISPLYLYPENEPRRPNLSPEFVNEITAKLGFEPTPEQIFYYIYAVFHAPTYRSRYAEFLKMDFPRVPLPKDAELFRELCKSGEELVGYHLMERSGSNPATYPIAGDDVVEKVRYSDGKVWINKQQYFENVPQDVWEFQIGGYQVCNKWLKDRKGRTLSYDDIRHYSGVVAALAETIRLMEVIDKTAARMFGWKMGAAE